MVRQHNRGRGFTLVELLVVIGIIAILMAILMPVFGAARRHAQDVICESNFRQFGLAIQAYANNNKDLLPQKGPDGSNQTTNNFGPTGGVKGYNDDSIWFNAIPPLMNSKSYYQMLLDDYTSQGGNPAPSWESPKNIFICPLQGPPASQTTASPPDHPAGDYYLLYGIDSTNTIKSVTGLSTQKQFKFALTYVFNSKLASSITMADLPNVKLSQCQPSSEVVLMTEKLANSGEYLDPGVQSWSKTYPTVYGTQINRFGYNSNVAQSKADWRRFTTRHHGGGFLLFADGHVSWYSWAALQPDQDPLPNATPGDANHYGDVVWSVQGPVD